MKTTISLAALGAIAAAIAATPALAQSAPGGFYVGALAGYEGITVDAESGSASADADSTVYGINAGYDIALGGGFFGVEGEYSTSDSSAEFPGSFTGARDALEAGGQYYIGARAGFALTPGIAAYGKAGYTSLDTRAFTQAGSLNQLEENAGGVRFGGGVQIGLPGPLEARVEYRRSSYDDAASPELGKITTDQVVAGLAFRF